MCQNAGRYIDFHERSLKILVIIIKTHQRGGGRHWTVWTGTY